MRGLGCFTEASGDVVRDRGAMTMYLSNRTVRSTGYELVEFVDVPPFRDDEPDAPPRVTPQEDDDTERPS